MSLQRESICTEVQPVTRTTYHRELCYVSCCGPLRAISVAIPHARKSVKFTVHTHTHTHTNAHVLCPSVDVEWFVLLWCVFFCLVKCLCLCVLSFEDVFVSMQCVWEHVMCVWEHVMCANVCCVCYAPSLEMSLVPVLTMMTVRQLIFNQHLSERLSLCSSVHSERPKISTESRNSNLVSPGQTGVNVANTIHCS